MRSCSPNERRKFVKCAAPSKVTIAILLATTALAQAASPLDLVEDLIASPSSPESVSLPPPPVKLDKNLRRALLKALVDLEAESAEQQQGSTDASTEDTTNNKSDDGKYDFLEISRQKSTSFSFNGFPNDEDIPSEDKLQNSSFVETDKYVLSDIPEEKKNKPLQPPKDYTKGVQVHHVIPSEKASAIYEIKSTEQLETVESRSIGSTSSSSDLNQIQKSVTFAPIMEILSVSASGNVAAAAAANSLIAPTPTASTKSHTIKAITKNKANSGSNVVQNKKKEGAEEVKIFQAPLVAAFTVQQDERGIPKSVVPLFKSDGASQSHPLTLQEQLEFKQRLLEKQLAQLQAQQAHQTQFLIRQRQAYEEQLRQKQQQEFYLQEQRRIKQLQEQERLLQQQHQQFSLQRFPQPNFQQAQQQLRLVQHQPIFQQLPSQQQQQQFKVTNVHLQPSLSLEVPSVVPAPPFQSSQTQLRQNFQKFTTNFQQPPTQVPLTRFNRQEALGSIGNFGFNNFQNDDKRNINQFVEQPQHNLAFSQFRQQPQQRPFLPVSTPARQIQDLLYQSGIAGELQGAGTKNQEDINIVSKVLALNVGAFPNSGQKVKGLQQQQFGILKK